MKKINFEQLSIEIYDRCSRGEEIISILKGLALTSRTETLEEIAIHYQEAADKLAIQMDTLGEERAHPWMAIHENLEDTAEEIRQFALLKKEE